jgi:hypothetical protein
MSAERTLISAAFPDVSAPGQLSVAVVSLIELCNLAMPDESMVRARIAEAGFEVGPQSTADLAGRTLGLDHRIIAEPLANMRHEIYGKPRHGAPVVLLLSTGDSPTGKMIFISSLFAGAIEADAVKAGSHVTKLKPLVGGRVLLENGRVQRRVFWQTDGAGGLLALVATGPDNVEAMDEIRAFVAFNKAALKR